MGGRGSSFKKQSNIKKVDKVDIYNQNIVNSYCKQTLNYLADYKDYEECVIIAKNGNVYYAKGNKYNVEIPDKYNSIAKFDLHNHPHDINRSFSNQDMASWKVGVEYYLTDGKYNYKAIIKKKIPYDSDLYSKSLQYAVEEKIINDDDQHIKCLYLKSKGYIDYERVERNT